MRSGTGKGKRIIIIIISIVAIFLLAAACFMLFKDSFVEGPKVENEDKEAEQLVKSILIKNPESYLLKICKGIQP